MLNPDPLYRQIAEDLRQQIESGGLTSGQQLRTELQFREHYGASRNTVRDAIKWLTTLGLVETRPGQGTFVCEEGHPFRHHPDRRPEDRDPAEMKSPTMDPRLRPSVVPPPTQTLRSRLRRRRLSSPLSCGSPKVLM